MVDEPHNPSQADRHAFNGNFNAEHWRRQHRWRVHSRNGAASKVCSRYYSHASRVGDGSRSVQENLADDFEARPRAVDSRSGSQLRPLPLFVRTPLVSIFSDI